MQREAKHSLDWLHYDIRLVAMVWNHSCSISEVCLSLVSQQSELCSLQQGHEVSSEDERATASRRGRKNTEDVQKEERDTEGEVHCLVGPRHGSKKAVEEQEREEAGGQGYVNLRDLIILTSAFISTMEELGYVGEGVLSGGGTRTCGYLLLACESPGGAGHLEGRPT